MEALEGIFDLVKQHYLETEDERLLEIRHEIGYQFGQLQKVNEKQQQKEIAFTMLTLSYIGACMLLFK